MNAKDLLKELKSLGKEQTRKTCRRHGIVGDVYGVSYADLGKLQKRIKINQPLAEELWATGNYDARVLATKIADPASFAKAIYGYRILPGSLINLAAMYLPWLELVAGSLLIVGAFTRGSSFILVVLLLAVVVLFLLSFRVAVVAVVLVSLDGLLRVLDALTETLARGGCGESQGQDDGEEKADDEMHGVLRTPRGGRE